MVFWRDRHSSHNRSEFYFQTEIKVRKQTGNTLQYSCLENPMDRGAWWVAVLGVAESDTTEWPHFHFSLSCIGEGNGNPLQCSCLENPRDGGAWWAVICGVAQSRPWLMHVIHLGCFTLPGETCVLGKECEHGACAACCAVRDKVLYLIVGSCVFCPHLWNCGRMIWELASRVNSQIFYSFWHRWE